MKKDLEKEHKKALSALEKTLMKKQQKKIEPTKTNEKQKRKISIQQPNVRSNIIGLPLIIIGVVFLFNPLRLNLKIGFTLVLIGSFMVFIISEKNKRKTKTDTKRKKTLDSTKKNRLLTSEKITLILSIWVVFLSLITSKTQIEIFFVLTFIGMLIVKELSDEYTTRNLKMRMNVFISIFLIAYIAIIAQKIINILDI